MIAIQTKYLGATNHKPSRIKAYTSNGHSCTIPLAYDLSNEKLHFEAVKALVAKCKLDWDISIIILAPYAILGAWIAIQTILTRKN